MSDQNASLLCGLGHWGLFFCSWEKGIAFLLNIILRYQGKDTVCEIVNSRFF
jgi:hypothetical protein